MRVDLPIILAVVLTGNFLVSPSLITAIGLLGGCIYFGCSLALASISKPSEEFKELSKEFSKAKADVDKIKGDHSQVLKMAEQITEHQKSTLGQRMYPASLLTRQQKG